jgi:hypothetical protein
MGWIDQLSNGVGQALEREGTVRIAVHSDAQAELGKSAAERMASSSEAASNLNFEIIPRRDQGQYPVGAILVP